MFPAEFLKGQIQKSLIQSSYSGSHCFLAGQIIQTYAFQSFPRTFYVTALTSPFTSWCDFLSNLVGSLQQRTLYAWCCFSAASSHLLGLWVVDVSLLVCPGLSCQRLFALFQTRQIDHLLPSVDVPAVSVRFRVVRKLQ